MLIWLLLLVLSALAILVAGSLTPGLTVTDFGSAFLLAAGMAAAGWLLMAPMRMAEGAFMKWLTGSAEPPMPLTGWWVHMTYVDFGFVLAENLVLFFVVGLLVPGVAIRRFLGPAIAIGLITLARYLLPHLIGAGLPF